MNKTYSKILSSAALMAIILSGCATIIEGKTETVTFDSEPAGAKVIVAGRVMGNTPITVPVEKDKNLAVT